MSYPVASSSTALMPNYTFDDLDYFCQKILPSIKVDELKLVIDALNRENNRRIQKTGRKSELVTRVENEYRRLVASNDVPGYRKARHAFTTLLGGYGAPRTGDMSSMGGVAGSQSARTGYANGMAASASGSLPRHSYGGAASSQAGPSTGWRATGSMAGGAGGEPQRFSHSATTSMTSTPRLSVAGYNIMLQWKASPMWRAVRALSDVIFVPAIDEHSNHERKAKMFYFDIPPDVQAAIKGQGKVPPIPGEIRPRRSVRLFCTTAEYHNGGAIRPPSEGIPIDFPNAPDLNVNGVVVTMKKGLKGRPNTAPPADLENGGVSTLRYTGAKQSVTFGHTGPSMNKKTKSPKRFILQVCLTETFTTADVRAKILAGKKKTREEVLGGLKKSAEEDEIQVGSTKMSLRCPLSYVRITTPIRSTKCTHLQCCELDSWLQINDQTPQFLCPTCDQEMTLETIFVDEYFTAISRACPDSVDEVIIEPDGEWHTEDSKYCSEGWKQPGPAPKAATPAGTATPVPKDSSPASAPDVKPKTVESKQQGEVIDLDLSSDESSDDDDDDEPDIPLAATRPAPRMSPPQPDRSAQTPLRSASPARAASANAADVVDLTGDTDDEGDQVVSVPSTSADPSPALESSSSHKRGRQESLNASDDDHVPFRPAQRPRVDSTGSTSGANGVNRAFSSYAQAQNGYGSSVYGPNGSSGGNGVHASNNASNGSFGQPYAAEPSAPSRSGFTNGGAPRPTGGGTDSSSHEVPAFGQPPSFAPYSLNPQRPSTLGSGNSSLQPFRAQPRVPSPLGMNGSQSPLTPLTQPSTNSPQTSTSALERDPFDALVSVAQRHAPPTTNAGMSPPRPRFDPPPPASMYSLPDNALDIVDAIKRVEAARAAARAGRQDT